MQTKFDVQCYLELSISCQNCIFNILIKLSSFQGISKNSSTVEKQIPHQFPSKNEEVKKEHMLFTKREH